MRNQLLDKVEPDLCRMDPAGDDTICFFPGRSVVRLFIRVRSKRPWIGELILNLPVLVQDARGFRGERSSASTNGLSMWSCPGFEPDTVAWRREFVRK